MNEYHYGFREFEPRDILQSIYFFHILFFKLFDIFRDFFTLTYRHEDPFYHFLFFHIISCMLVALLDMVGCTKCLHRYDIWWMYKSVFKYKLVVKQFCYNILVVFLENADTT